MPILLFHLELSASIRSISEFPKRSETDGRYTPSEKCREKDTISEKVKARVTLLGTQHIEKKIGIWALARNFGPLWPALARFGPLWPGTREWRLIRHSPEDVSIPPPLL